NIAQALGESMEAHPRLASTDQSPSARSRKSFNRVGRLVAGFSSFFFGDDGNAGVAGADDPGWSRRTDALYRARDCSTMRSLRSAAVAASTQTGIRVFRLKSWSARSMRQTASPIPRLVSA